MSITSLPNETILQIISCLSIGDAESVAQTWNTKLTPVCLTRLRHWLPFVRNHRRIVAIFGKPLQDEGEEDCHYISRDYICSDALACKSPFDGHARERLRVLSCLLDDFLATGSLDWLKPVTISDNLMSPPSPSQMEHFVITQEHMHHVESAAQGLGLTLPKGFTQFMTNLDFQQAAGFFCSLGPLVKIRSFDKHYIGSDEVTSIDGYTCRIDSGDDRALTHIHLYMDCHGGQCVLIYTPDWEDRDTPHVYPNDTITEERRHLQEIWKIARSEWEDMRSDVEKLLGIGIFDGMCTRSEPDLELVASSFEEFIFRTYHEYWIRRIGSESRTRQDLPDHLKDYLIKVYSK